MSSSFGNQYAITGGTGFLGGVVLPEALSRGAKVRLVVRRDVNDLLDGVTAVHAALDDVDSLTRAFQGCDGVFHLAGLVVHSRSYGKEELWETNVVGTMNVMRAAHAAGCRRVVYASSSGVVGCSLDPDVVASDSSPYCEEVVQHWPYYVSKIEAEREARAFAAKHDIELVCMRPTMMWGPGDDRYRSTKLVLSFLTRHLPFIPPGGVSWVDVRDVATAFVNGMERGRPGSTYLLGARNCSTFELFNLLQKLSGVPRPAISVPSWFARSGATGIDWFNRKIRRNYDASVDPVRAEMGCHFWNISSISAEEDLSFFPRPFQETAKETIDFIRKNEPTLFKINSKL